GGDRGAVRVEESVDAPREGDLNRTDVELHVCPVVVGEGVKAAANVCKVRLGHRAQHGRAVRCHQRERAVAVVHQVKVAEVGRQFVDGRLNLGGRQAAGGVVVCDVGSIHVYGGDRGAVRVEESVDAPREGDLNRTDVELHVCPVVVGEGVKAAANVCKVRLGHRAQHGRAVRCHQRERAVAVVHQVKVAEVGRKLVDGRLNLGGRQAAGGVVVCDVGSIHVYGGDRGAVRVEESVDAPREGDLNRTDVELHVCPVVVGEGVKAAANVCKVRLGHRAQHGRAVRCHQRE